MTNMRGVSILEIARPIRAIAKGANAKNPKTIVDGIVRDKYPLEEGYHVATPGQMLSLLVPVQQLAGDEIIGFQRKADPAHSRKIAKAILNGHPMPTIEVAL